MTKNGLAPEGSPDERPQKRQRLAPPPPTNTTTTTTTPSIPSANSDSQHPITTTTSSSSANNSNTVSKMEEDSMEGVINQMVTINTDDRERECEVGIVHFVNVEQKGFTGILKQRYTDFLVNEIALDGTVLHLKTDRAPNFAAAAKAKEKENASSANNHENAQPEREETGAGVKTEPETIKPVEEVKAEPTIKEEPTIKGDASEGQPKATTQASSTEDKPDAAIKEEPTDKFSESAKTTEVEGNSTAEGNTDVPANTTTPVFNISAEDEALLASYFDEAFKDEILQFHKKILAKPNAKHNSFGSILSPPFANRVLRGEMHAAMRRIFESRLETLTLDEGIKISAMPKGNTSWHGREGTVVQQQASNSRGQRSNQTKGKLGWQELGGEYLHFNLYKENKDTMEVTSYLARGLKINPRDFAFAGTKDRRAVTVQRVSVFRQHAKELARQNAHLRSGRIGDFKYEKFPLKLGELNGNLFTIALRDCHFEGEDDLNIDGKLQLANSVLTDAVKHFESNGFLNYFGLQRFGTFGIGTHDVGKLILNNDFEGAVKSILTYNHDLLKGDPNSTDKVGRDDISRARAINLFEQTGNSRGPLEELPRKFSAETAVIRHLGNKMKREDFSGALQGIPRNLKTMYVHAYQSLVWNTVASERWIRYGAKVVEGDLVMVDVGNAKSAQVKDEVDQNGEIVVHPADDDTAMHLDDMFERARALSAEEAESGKYTIFDIVLPTPGFDIEYPANDIGDYYKEFMASERGGGLDPSNMRRAQKDFSLSGNYRKLLSQAKNLSFEIKTCNNDTDQLAETDLDILDKGRPKPEEREQTRQFGQNDFYGQRGNGGRGRGRGGFFQTNDRGSRGGYGQNSRGARGGYNNDHNGRSNRIYRDIRLEEAEEAQKLAEANGTAVQPGVDATATPVGEEATQVNQVASTVDVAHTASLNAWNALPAQLAAEREAAGKIARLRRDNPVEIDSSTIIQSEIRETYIHTDLDEDGRRRVKSKNTSTLGSNGNGENNVAQTSLPEKLDEVLTAAPPTSVEIDSSAVEAIEEPTNTDEKTLSDPLSPKSEKNTEAGSNQSSSSASGGGVLLNPKIAVIIKFALGPSQYATMALRELMKAGGVKTYKPDYSSGR